MKTNLAMKSSPLKTHEGATAKRINPELQLRRLVLSCMLWEDQFYIDGISHADLISDAVANVSGEIASRIAIEARNDMKLRHVPLLIVREMARLSSHKKYVKDTLAEVIQRPDELTEFLSIYWKDGKEPISNQVKKGLAKAFTKFNEYSLSKYNQKNSIKLRDVLFLTHAKPLNFDQELLWKRLINDDLKTPDTWEVALSSTDGISKKDKWLRLLKENKLGALALLRNLRNMTDVGIDRNDIVQALENIKTERVLPFRFIAASTYVPGLEDSLEKAMFKCLEGHTRFKGETVLLVDVSGSMDSGLSRKSDMNRLSAACALAMLVREVCDNVRIFTFSEKLVEIPNRRGFALRDAIIKSQPHRGTYLGSSVRSIYGLKADDKDSYWHRRLKFEPLNLNPDRLIVFTDEQSHDKIPDPKGLAYMINVASYKNGIGYGSWNHIDGFSEKIIDFIQMLENIEG